MSDTPRRPTLYQLAEDGCSVELLFVRCGVCGHLTFPASSYGCANCGAPRDKLETEARPGGGALLAYVTIHAEVVPGVKGPTVVGEIEIAPGLIEEGLIDAAEEDLSIGMALKAVAKPALGTNGVFECWFAPEAAQ